MALYDLQIGFCHRMLGHKNRTTILIGQDRSLIGSYFFGQIHNFHLVKPDQRPENRKAAYFIGHCQGLHRLGSHLADALSCDQAKALVLVRYGLRNPHHISAHNDGQLLMRAFLVDIKLDVRKVDHVKINRPCITGHQLR